MRRPFGSSSQAVRNEPLGGGACQIQSIVVGPAMASSKTAASRTVRASGPCTDSPLISPSSGATEIRPRLVLMPTNPLTLEGMRIEPPPSLPGAAGSRPAATAAPVPPLDPPAEQVRSQGVRCGGWPSGSV